MKSIKGKAEELSIEEKAKRYDEAIERAKKVLLDCTSEEQKVVEYITPELKESEDEEIRKVLLGHFSRYQKEEVFLNNITMGDIVAWLEKQGEQKPNPYSGTSFEYNGHTWGMCARDNGVEILIDGHIKGRVFTDDSNAKEMFIKALERVEEQNNKGYKLTDCDKNSWWEDFKAYTSFIIKQKPTGVEEVNFFDDFRKTDSEAEPKFHEGEWSEKDKIALDNALWCCKQAASIAKDENDMGNVWYAENWLKSLKDRYTWKPSDLQIKLL